MNVQAFLTAVVLAIAVAAVSMTVARAKVSKGFRIWVDGKSTWLGDLFNCPYCLSHWLAFFAVAWYRPRVISSNFVIFDWIVSAFLIVALASVASAAIRLASFSTGSHVEKDKREPRQPERPPVDGERPQRLRARVEQ